MSELLLEILAATGILVVWLFIGIGIWLVKKLMDEFYDD